MRYIKTYEDINTSDDFKIGDIVVSLETKYADNTNWLHQDYKYKIMDIELVGDGKLKLLKVREVGFPFTTPDEYRNDYNGDFHTLSRWFEVDDFISLKEWELKQTANKYNL